jgi:hypothetical protein
LPDCDDIRERVKLERSVYLHGMLPADLLGGPEEMLRKVPATVMGRNVEAVDLTRGSAWGRLFAPIMRIWVHKESDTMQVTASCRRP